MNPLATAELAIYAVLSIPVLYIFVRHWRAGLLGWFYLFAFCTLRIVGGAMSISSDGGSASIISSIGLSPLLLAASGILHEARVYRAPDSFNKTFEWIVVALFHVLVSSGLGLVAAGSSALQSGSSNTASSASNLQLVQVGIGILTGCWALLVVWAASTLSPSRQEKKAMRYRQGTVLLFSVILSLIFIGIRVMYSLVAFTTQKPYLNPVTGSVTVRVLLSFLPELISTLIFIFAGFWTRRLD